MSENRILDCIMREIFAHLHQLWDFPTIAPKCEFLTSITQGKSRRKDRRKIAPISETLLIKQYINKLRKT